MQNKHLLIFCLCATGFRGPTPPPPKHPKITKFVSLSRKMSKCFEIKKNSFLGDFADKFDLFFAEIAVIGSVLNSSKSARGLAEVAVHLAPGAA